MRAVLAILLFLAAGAAAAQERWFPPRLWLRALAPDGGVMVVEPQSGYWPSGTWLRVALTGAVAELPPPAGCRWTAMAFAPDDGRLATAVFCPAAACADARAALTIEGKEAWSERGRRIADLVWRRDGGGVAGVVSRFAGGARGLRGLTGGGSRGSECQLSPEAVIEVAADGSRATVVSALPAHRPPTASRLRLVGHDGAGYLATVGYDGPANDRAAQGVEAAIRDYCAAHPGPEFGRPCGGAGGAVLARLDGDAAAPVLLGGGPVSARTLAGPGFFLSETCAVEQLSRRRIRGHCDLVRWDPPFETPRPLTDLAASLGGLAISADGRTVAALNPFDEADSTLILIDADTGAATRPPIQDWVRAAFAATGRTVRRDDEE